METVSARMLSVPGTALASGGVQLLNEELIHLYHLDRADVDRVVRREEAELQRRELLYRGDRPLTDLRGKTVAIIGAGTTVVIDSVHVGDLPPFQRHVNRLVPRPSCL